MTIDLEQLHQSGEINGYFYNQLNKKLPFLPADLQETYIEEAINMSQVGINSNEEQKHFFYIILHTPEIIRDILTRESSKNMDVVSRIAAKVYKNLSKYPINTVVNFFYAVAKAAEELGFDVRQNVQEKLRTFESSVSLSKSAYPQGYQDPPMMPPYDVSRWMTAIRDIYSRAAFEGLSLAFDTVTENWDKMEKLDFQYFLRFYQEGNPKYKIAQKYYESGNNGYFVPNYKPQYNDLKSVIPSPVSVPKIDFFEQAPKQQPDTNDIRDKIEAQRSKLISRLNAAEKLLYSIEGQYFAGDDQDEMLRILQELKRRIQTANKIRIRSSLFEDYVYRTANQLWEEKRPRAASFFYKLAQDLPFPPSEDPAGALLGDSEELPVPGEEAPPSDLGGGNIKEDTRNMLEEFFDRLETGVIDTDDEEIIAKAQLMPNERVRPTPAPEERPAPEVEISADDAFEKALAGVSIEDVVKKLENVTTVYKQREIYKQLSIIDLMLDKLGLASFFPALGEAARSALDSNQYVLTRIEDILSKLRGAVKGKSENLLEVTEDQLSPEAEGVKTNLIQQKQKEEERKERRRQKEDAKMAPEAPPAAETPKEELAAPVRVQRGPEQAAQLR